MTRIYLLAFVLIVILPAASCKNPTSSILNEDESGDQVYTLAVAQPMHADIENFYKSLKSETSITEHAISILPHLIDDIEITEKFVLKRKVQMGNRGDLVDVDDSFVAVRFGGIIFVFKCVIGSCQIFDSVPATYLSNKPVVERAKSAIDAKYYERDRIARLNSNLDAIDFVARMVPGVNGLDQAINAPSLTDKVVGVISATGDFATFGLGSKINTIRKISGSTVLASSSVRIMHAAKKSYEGEANLGTGIDAALASIEAVLASVTFIKIRVGSVGRGVVRNVDEAEKLAPTLNRSADDILRNGLSEEELVILGIRKTASNIPNTTIKGKELVNLRNQFPNFKDEVLIGLDDSGHAFLVVKGKQVHAAPFAKTKIKGRATNLSKPGVYVRLKGLDNGTLDDLANGIRNNSPGRSLTCSQGACSILNEHGNIMVGNGGLFENARPSAMLKNILDRKLTISSGPRKGELVDFDVFISGPQRIDDFVNKTAALETAIGAGAASALTGEFVIINIVKGEPLEESATNTLLFILY